MEHFKLLLILSFGLFIMSCSEDNTAEIESFEDGILIGNRGITNGRIDFIQNTTNTISTGVFQTINEQTLDGQLVAFTKHNDDLFTVLNTDKVERTTAATLLTKASIIGFEQARYFLGVNENKAYVSQWGNDGLTGSVAVVDLNTNAITKTIPTGKGADKMVMKGSFVYVVNTGGLGIDSTITVINTATDEVETTITVGLKPNSLALFGANFLVLCGGDETTAGTVWRVAAFSPGKLLDFDTANETPSHLIETADDRYLCLYKGNIHQIEISGLNFTLSSPIVTGNFEAFTLDLSNNHIYAFTENSLERYSIDGIAIDNFSGLAFPVEIVVN